MLTTVLSFLLSGAKWLRTNPKVLLAMIVVGVFAYGWHERGQRIVADERAAVSAAHVTTLTRAFSAQLDTTAFYRGRYQRQVVVLDSLPKALQKHWADSLAKGERLVAGVAVTTLAQSAKNVERPATESSPPLVVPDTAKSSIDTLGVQASVTIAGPRAWWNVYRAPTTLSISFVHRPDSSMVAEATSSDGARLQIDVPFLLQPTPVVAQKPGWWGWKFLEGFGLGSLVVCAVKC